MWCWASWLPMPRDPECSITHTWSSLSRQTSTKWLPPPSVPIWRNVLSARAFTTGVRSSNIFQNEVQSFASSSVNAGSRCWANPTGTTASRRVRSRRSESGRSFAVSDVRTAAMPQPMSTPTAAGDTASRSAITDPTVAPLPKCTSGITATCLTTHGSAAMFCSCCMANGSTSSVASTCECPRSDRGQRLLPSLQN